MAKYLGTIEQLQGEIATLGLPGKWSETENAFKFTTPDGAYLLFYWNTTTLQVQGKANSNSKTRLLEFAEIIDGKETLPVSETKSANAVAQQELFVVYGHDRGSRDQLELILTTLSIEHIILGRDGGNGLTLIEELDKHVGKDGTARTGIVLLTPDDMGYSIIDGDAAAKYRARQNVVMEMGMLLGTLGRTKTIILVKGDIEKPSDVAGIFYLQYHDHVNQVVLKLAERLESCGFVIDHKKLTRFQ